MSKGLDVGTSFLITAVETETGVEYKEFRDAFFRIKPATPIAAKMLQKGLANVSYFKDVDGSFVVVGSDAITKAIERNSSASRPLFRGVISPREPQARRVLKFILSELVGKPETPGETLVYSIPAEPVDQSDEDFNTGFHEDCLQKDLAELGWNAQSLNEAEAIGYSELEDEDYTGITMSFGAGMVNVCVMSSGEPVIKFSTTKCLAKDFLITTENRGLVPIQNVIPGDICLDYNGQPSEVITILNNGNRKSLTRLHVTGYSQPMDMTHDHKVFAKIKKHFNWSWQEASKLQKGDLLGIPIIKPDPTETNKSIYFYRKDGTNFSVTAGRKLGQFFGYFLGDGTAYILSKNNSDGRIACSFNQSDEKHIEIYSSLMSELFGKDCYQEDRKDQNCTVLRSNSIDLVKSLKRLCYRDDEKHLNIPLHKISHQMGLGIIEGLFATDGWISNGKYNFENTSSSLVMMLQGLLARFGIFSTLTIREPRQGGLNNKGEQIVGKKQIYRLQIGKTNHNVLLNHLMTYGENSNLPITDQCFMHRKIKSIETIDYNDDVYDLVMGQNSHCFNSPGGIVHNSGDWIDRMAAQSTGEADSVVQVEKENGSFVVGQESENQILSAVSAYYVRLVDYTVAHLANHLRKSPDLPKFTNPVSVVVSGGTSRANGFVDAFRARMSKEDFPVQIKEVRHASDPLRAVARGCLIASSMG